MGERIDIGPNHMIAMYDSRDHARRIGLVEAEQAITRGMEGLDMEALRVARAWQRHLRERYLLVPVQLPPHLEERVGALPRLKLDEDDMLTGCIIGRLDDGRTVWLVDRADPEPPHTYRAWGVCEDAAPVDTYQAVYVGNAPPVCEDGRLNLAAFTGPWPERTTLDEAEADKAEGYAAAAASRAEGRPADPSIAILVWTTVDGERIAYRLGWSPDRP